MVRYGTNGTSTPHIYYPFTVREQSIHSTLKITIKLINVYKI